MEAVGARLGRSSARYGPATTFTGPVRKWRKEWVPIAAAAATAASSAGTGSGTGSQANNLALFKWTPLNGTSGAGSADGEQAAPETATRKRRYEPVSVVEEQTQDSTKYDDENEDEDKDKDNDEDPSSTETEPEPEPSNGKTNINDTPMDESQASDGGQDSGNNGGGTDLNLNLGPKDPDDDNEGDMGEQHKADKDLQTEHRSKRKAVMPDLEMRM